MLKKISETFAMDDATWKRHASPWSVWTRFATLPFLALAIWSRTWIGQWAWLPVIILSIWLWFNPRAFAAPKHTNNWASKATFGERVLLNKKTVTIPKHHAKASSILSALAGFGVPFLVYGLYYLEIWPTILGVSVIYIGKMWFLDRMVWLYEDMKDKNSEYKGWLY